MSFCFPAINFCTMISGNASIVEYNSVFNALVIRKIEERMKISKVKIIPIKTFFEPRRSNELTANSNKLFFKSNP